MTARYPIVLVAGALAELPGGDALAGVAFTQLSDAPSSYSGAGLEIVRVNAGATALEFHTFAAGDVTAALGYTPVNRAGDTMTGLLVLSGDPTAALGAATKQYVDAVAAGLTWKTAVVCASSATLTLSGEQTIDGVTTAASRVLVKNQTTGSQNGIYVSATGAWARSADCATGPEIVGATVLVEQGTAAADQVWTCNNTAITLGTTAITFVQVAAGGGSGSPGGSTNAIQYNNGGAFGGISGSTAGYVLTWQASGPPIFAAGGGGGGSSPIFKTGNYTAVAGDIIIADTSGGAFTITLPASPSAGQTVQIWDIDTTFFLNPLTIDPIGGKINGQTMSQKRAQGGERVFLTWENSTIGWIWISNFGVGSIFDTIKSTGNAVPINGNRSVITNGLAYSVAAGFSSARTTGKLYFEFRVDLRTSGQDIFLGFAGSATLNFANYLGLGANDWGYFNGSINHNNGTVSSPGAFVTGDTVGIAADFTATTGGVHFYKNNTSLYSVTGLTLPSSTFAIGSGQSSSGGQATVRTSAVQCKYSPPSGYSYWDA